ncbi:guanylate kinase [bacterium]|nr:MAG: guanylate kinase [bacterium]
MTGRLVILSGPSGVGKDTVIDAWKARDPRVTRVIAYTTRAPRAGEKDGVDYHFVSVDQFLECANAGEFLEAKEVHGHHYATPLKDMNALLEAGKVAVLKIDVQGALTAMALRPDATSVFLLPPDGHELARRLRDRGTDDEDTIARRLENAKAELALAERYQHRIVNDSVDAVVEKLVSLTG